MPHSDDPSVPRRATGVRWRIVLILMGMTGLNHFHRQSLPSVVDRIMRDNGLDEVQMGWVFTAFLCGYVAFMIPGGWLADKIGGRAALLLSGLGTAAAVSATGYCGYGLGVSLAFAALLAVRGVMGALSTPLFPAAGRVVAAWIPFESRAWANGLVLGATTIGVSAAPIVFGALADLFGWRNALVLAGGGTAFLTCLWWIDGRDRPEDHPHVNGAERAHIRGSSVAGAGEAAASPPGRLVEMLADPNLLLLTLSYAAVGYYEYTLFYWMKYYFQEILRYGEETSRYLTAIVASAMIVAMPLGGVLSDRLVATLGYRRGRSLIPIVGLFLSAALLFAATRAEGQALVVALFFLSHAAIGLVEAPTWVAGLEIGRAHCGTSASIVNFGGNFGGLLAPVATAYVGKKYGFNAGFLVASAAVLIAVALWAGIRLKDPTGDRSQSMAE